MCFGKLACDMNKELASHHLHCGFDYLIFGIFSSGHGESNECGKSPHSSREKEHVPENPTEKPTGVQDDAFSCPIHVN